MCVGGGDGVTGSLFIALTQGLLSFARLHVKSTELEGEVSEGPGRKHTGAQRRRSSAPRSTAPVAERSLVYRLGR